MRVTFWGTRGSIPAPGPETARYGGNTTCLEVVGAEGTRVIMDAGTGIRALGRSLAAGPPGEVSLLISHLHWDHMLGFPFFVPAYQPGWRIEVGGWPRALKGLAGLFEGNLQDGRFPVAFGDLPAAIRQTGALDGPRFQVGEMQGRTCPLNHPQGGVGLRLEERGRALVFLTDNELAASGPTALDEFARFCAGAAVLVHDAQYLPEELPHRVGWGHSSWEEAVRLAALAGVERLILTHHDPDRTDGQVDELLAAARAAAPAGLVVDAAREGMSLDI